MSDEYYSVNSYSTFTTQFSATLIQADPVLLSDIFDVSIDFIWTSPDLASGNAAFLKIKYFLEEVLHQSVFTHKDAPMNINGLENVPVMFPYVPTNDIIAMTLHAKLNAIAGEFVEVISVKVASKYTFPIMSYTYADDHYEALPSLKDFTGYDVGEYFYETPWWFRSSPETYEHEIDEDTDLTSPPDYDNVLDDLEKIVLGELKLSNEGGQVVDIKGWKPKIIDD
jgi:hypothetical protein